MENCHHLIFANCLFSKDLYEIDLPGLPLIAVLEIYVDTESFYHVRKAVEEMRLRITNKWHIIFHPFGGILNTKEGYCSCFAKAPNEFGNPVLFRLSVENTTRTFVYDSNRRSMYGSTSFCALEYNDMISTVRLTPIRALSPAEYSCSFHVDTQMYQALPTTEILDSAQLRISRKLFSYLKDTGEANNRDAFTTLDAVLGQQDIVLFPFGLHFSDKSHRPAVALRPMLVARKYTPYVFYFYVNNRFIGYFHLDLTIIPIEKIQAFGFMHIDPKYFFFSESGDDNDLSIITVLMCLPQGDHNTPMIQGTPRDMGNADRFILHDDLGILDCHGHQLVAGRN
mmetsp:Transcript_4101/g.5119  ORF Transcript_4101/g.5119 Transcript_4101/m.5119 type:complete len:339 (-) Transcript_4101:80-1096(-)